MEAQKSYGRWDMAPGDVLYPLRAASDTGYGTLHVLGDPTALADEAMVTVVGSMRETPYGAAVSEMIGRTAADLGIVLVCDQTRGCAHDAMPPERPSTPEEGSSSWRDAGLTWTTHEQRWTCATTRSPEGAPW